MKLLQQSSRRRSVGRYFRLIKLYGHTFRVLEKTPKGKHKGVVYFVAVDTEYEEDDKGRTNKILSYQVSVFTRFGYGEKVHITANGKRLTLKQVVRMALREVNNGKMPKGKIQVFLVAHYSAAEISALSDRDEVRKSLRVVRKSAVTKRMIKMKIGSAKVVIHLYDTRLISPGGAQSLEDLAKLLNSADSEKIVIPDYDKSRMGQLLRDNPDLFIEYGLQDARVTLEAFLLLQECLNQQAFGEFRRLFKTIGSSTVAGFTERYPGFNDYLQQLRKSLFREAIGKMRQCFMGGFCTNYFVGATRDYAPTRHHIIVDIDITSAYPVFMFLIAMVDVNTSAIILRTRYQINDEVADALIKDGLDSATVEFLRQSLETTPAMFKAEVSRLVKGKKHRDRVLALTVVVDNTLVDKWFSHSQMTEDEFGVLVATYVLLGCAYVRFEFPEGTKNPCLAIPHSKYGLQYVRKGETLATSVEIIAALEAGAKIEALYSVEFPLARDGEGEPVYVVRDHLKYLVTERRKHPKKSVMNLLYKEAANGFYGKFGQGINRRRVTEISTGESRELGPSPITEPVMAATVTGIGRAALTMMSLSVERFNEGRPDDQKIYVMSATTDGFLVILPAPPDTSVEGEFYEEVNGKLKFIEPSIKSVLAQFGCEGLLAEMDKFSVLRQLKASNKELVGGDHFLEVKHVADHAVGIKSRGQIGYLNNGDASILAKCGLRPPRPASASGDEIRRAEAEWVDERFKEAQSEHALIESYTTDNLPSLGKILDPGGPDDMVMITQKKTINVDCDFKRKPVLLSDGSVSPVMAPHETFAEMKQHRRVMERIRKRGESATLKKVLHELNTKGKSTRLVNGDAGAIVRGVLRGVQQGHFGERLADNYAEIASRITSIWRLRGYDLISKKKVWTRDDLKNATRGMVEYGFVMPSLKNIKLVDSVCQVLDLNVEIVRTALFSRVALDEVLDRVVEQVVLAVLHAADMGLEPFVNLRSEGLLPGHQDLVNILFPRVTDLSVMASKRGTFIPGSLAERDQGQVAKIFTWFSIPKEQARAAAKIIAPNALRELGQNPTVNDRLVDEFVMAALDQSVVAPAPVPDPDVLLTKLRFFGLTVKRINRLRHSRLNPNALANTPVNRQQVKNMAMAIDISAEPFLSTLLGGR
jgi:hypothetical protein